MPSSLIFQWSNEIKKFFTSASVYRYHGKQRKEQELSNFDIIISSYRTVQLDIHLLEALTFHTLILDEAHKIKNPSSQTFKAIISLKAHFKLSLTGTPIENALHEIWAQFHCLMPKLLAPYSEIKGQLQSQDPTFMTSLKQKIKPFILRRSKKEVAPELPDKIEQITWIEMSEDESILYQNFLSQAQDILQECVEKPSIQILEAILRLRQFCCHPLLVSSLLEQEPNFMPEKFSLVLEDVQNIYLEGYKIILCSQFTSCLSLLAQALCKQGIPNLSLTGKTQDKASIVDEFQNTPTPSVMLMSLKAGGVGLNLTAADYVLLYDPWWNDAVENQAIDRAHRIGRKHTVFAKRYLYNNSIEEKMLSLKKQKSLLSNNFMEGTHKALCKEDFEFLLEAF